MEEGDEVNTSVGVPEGAGDVEPVAEGEPVTEEQRPM